jgi:hypothetical protein
MRFGKAILAAALAAGAVGCGGGTSSPPASTPSAASTLNLTGIGTATKDAGGNYHVQLAKSLSTSTVCQNDQAQLWYRLRQAGVTGTTSMMIALDGGDNAPGRTTICAVGP